jgi:uncharacterized protein YecE (DUF72 family)
MKLWLGTSGFQYPEWKGKFYPAGMPASKMLSYYGEHFSSTEINYTFRRIPAEKTILGWAALTPRDFRFSFKAPQRVTHFAKLRGCADVMSVFAKAIAVGQDKTGPVLFQLPPTFAKDVETLRLFLEDPPSGVRVAFEFRHESWFDDAVFNTLRSANAALCVAESEDLATPPVATADFGYLRLRREDYTPAQIKRWAAWVGEQTTCWTDAYVYFKHEERALGPQFARKFKEAFDGRGKG